MRRSFLAIAILCAAIALPAVEEAPVPKPEKPAKAAKAPALTVEDLPAAVRATAEAQAAGATIDKVRADERGGEKTYSVRFVRDGVKTELRLSAEGKVVRMKAERGDDTSSVPTTSLPAAVQTAVATKLDGGKIVEIEEKMVKDAMVYQIEIATATGRVEIEIDADGKILSEKAKKAEEPKAKKEKKEKKDKAEVPAN
jgi:hypothetical protein